MNKHRMFLRGVLLLIVLLPAWVNAQVLVGVTAGGMAEGWEANPGTVVLIDPTSGDTLFLAQPFGGEGLSGIAMAADGTVYVSTGPSGDGYSHLLIIDPTTGNLIQDVGEIVDASGNACAIGDLSIDPTDGTLYGIAANGDIALDSIPCGAGFVSTGGYLVSIDTETAEFTLRGRQPELGNETAAFAFTSDGANHFIRSWRPDGFDHQLDLADGSYASSLALSAPMGWFGLGTDLGSDMMYGTAANYVDSCCTPDEANLYTIDPSDGTVTLVGPTPPNVFIHDVIYDPDGLFVLPTTVPVATLSGWSLLLLALALGLASIGYVRRHG